MTAAGQRRVCELLLVDDDRELRTQMARNLCRLGYQTVEADSLRAAVEILQSHEIPLAIVDLVLPDGSGVDLIDQLRAAGQDECAVVMLSGQGTITTAVEAMKRGASDFLTKPVRLQELDATLQRVLENQRLKRENQQLKELLRQQRPDHRIVGESAPMLEVFRLIGKVGPTDKPVLIQGESGTGKELVAQALAETSPLRDHPFVTINCAALPESLLESELFGHEKGAFTGAQSAKQGLFEVADGGTLFIDEIGELAPGLQAKLLRVLEDGSFRRVGSTKERKVRVRLLAATNRDLATEVRAGRFREDLFYRINVLTLTLPPLRERGGDLPRLIEHFAGPDWESEAGLPDQLARYSWPGNVRQLRNAIERAKILATGNLIELANFPPEVVAGCQSSETAPEATAGEDLEAANRRHILHAYQQAGGNKVRAAQALGVTRRTLYRLLEKYGIE
ncbi:sigma-54-dependent transcriptional regulator [Planctellipticum variicoloris]|uniref:sigma-54-dependent transcriptional regulator n=1 Tax=Planctellipticum variicoloris TaxID=3064265 RepID=UPI00301380B0|nr:sigma-54 dependent transcriptional regulator [Planctomycetaceae bacterium SH412]